jgi:hypothetical protein
MARKPENFAGLCAVQDPAQESMFNRSDDRVRGVDPRANSLSTRQSCLIRRSRFIYNSCRPQNNIKIILSRGAGSDSQVTQLMPPWAWLAHAANAAPARLAFFLQSKMPQFPWYLPTICVGPSTGAPCHAEARAMPLEPKQEKPALTGLPFPPHRPGSRQPLALPVFTSPVV